MQPFEFKISSTLWPVGFSVCTLDAFELLSLFLVPQFTKLILMLYKNVTWFSIKIPRTEIPFLKLHGAGIAV